MNWRAKTWCFPWKCMQKYYWASCETMPMPHLRRLQISLLIITTSSRLTMWGKHLSFSFQEDLPSSRRDGIGKLQKFLHGMCHSTQFRHVQGGVVSAMLLANETLWSLPLTVNVHTTHAHIVLCVLTKTLISPESALLLTMASRAEILVQKTCMSDTE